MNEEDERRVHDAKDRIDDLPLFGRGNPYLDPAMQSPHGYYVRASDGLALVAATRAHLRAAMVELGDQGWGRIHIVPASGVRADQQAGASGPTRNMPRHETHPELHPVPVHDPVAADRSAVPGPGIQQPAEDQHR